MDELTNSELLKSLLPSVSGEMWVRLEARAVGRATSLETEVAEALIFFVDNYVALG
jgi:hypothetical protein